jgi:hypothetical protein
MTSQPHLVGPPRIAVWLLRLFALDNEAEPMFLDELLEKFLCLVSKTGGAFARRWYWRQTIKTVVCLASVSFRTAPWSTAAAVLAGYLLRRLIGPMVEPAILVILERSQAWEHHHSVSVFLAGPGTDIGHLMTFSFIGLIAALMVRGREMAVTTALALLFGTIALVGSTYGVARTGDVDLLWRLTWSFADCFAVIVSGVIIRTSRLTQPRTPTVARSQT